MLYNKNDKKSVTINETSNKYHTFIPQLEYIEFIPDEEKIQITNLTDWIYIKNELEYSYYQIQKLISDFEFELNVLYSEYERLEQKLLVYFYDIDKYLSFYKSLLKKFRTTRIKIKLKKREIKELFREQHNCQYLDSYMNNYIF